MIGISAFRATDAARIRLQPEQYVECGTPFHPLEDGEALAAAGPGWTMHEWNGPILACFGLAEQYPGRQAVGWALLAENLGACRHLTITRTIRHIIAVSEFRRIDVMVKDDPAGRGAKWARLIGLDFRCAMDAWGAASERVLLFDRVKP